MSKKIYDPSDLVKRVDTGEAVRVVEVLPLNRMVFYRIESKNGDTTLVPAAKLAN